MSGTGKLNLTAGAWVRPLADVRENAAVGGKALNLARMIRSGIEVPAGFVVTNAAFQRFIHLNGLREPAEALQREMNVNNPASVRATSDAIAKLAAAAVMPREIVDAIRCHCATLEDAGSYVVRSSAVGEDSEHATFAGQLDSFLHLQGDAAIIRAVQDCWSSYWSDRSLFYQASRGIDLNGMGVIVQRQVAARLSGVLFTRNPDPTVRPADAMIAEYCVGEGTALVSGQVNPGRIRLDRSGSPWTSLAEPDQPGAAEESVSEELVFELARTGAEIEDLFDRPQDIEWVVGTDGSLSIVQSRPITVSPLTHEPAAERPTVLWSNANVNENYPAPICPLLYSIASAGYYHYFRNLGLAIGLSRRRVEAMEIPLRQIIGVHGARMYYNLTNIHACLRMAPCGKHLTESFNNFVGADRTADPGVLPCWQTFRRGRIAELFELVRIGFSSLRQFLSLGRSVVAFERAVDQYAERVEPDRLGEASRDELLEHLRGFFDIRCHKWTGASLADAAAMLSYGLLKRMLNREFPEADHAALHNTLLKGLTGLVSNEPVTRLWALSRDIRNDERLQTLFRTAEPDEVLAAIQTEDFTAFREKFASYQSQCGFRCSGELMLTVPSFQENPARVVELLRAYAELEGDSPVDRLREQNADRDAATAQVLRDLKRRPIRRFLPWPRKSMLARRLLSWTQRSISLRERARLKQALLYSRYRRLVLAIGDRLVAQNQLNDREAVFLLTHQEIDDVLTGRCMFSEHLRELTEPRRRAHEELARMCPPDTFELPAGDVWSARRFARPTLEQPTEGTHDEWHGTGACGGHVTARATVLEDVSEFDQLSEGDVLVTRQTDPGWAPVFFLIRGLVIERGGMLSHGAILAREYGIPTVVGVRDATRQIPDGHVVSVDGDRGVVRVHPS